MSGTSRGPSEDSQETDKKIDSLVKKMFLDAIVLVLHICYCFLLEKKCAKVLIGNVHGTSTGPSCRTSWGPDDGTFWGRPQDVGHTCFLNSTQKHISRTLKGYSRLYSELQVRSSFSNILKLARKSQHQKNLSWKNLSKPLWQSTLSLKESKSLQHNKENLFELCLDGYISMKFLFT